MRLPPLARAALRVVESFTSPLRPDDYLELINPLWSTRELRGRIERVRPETRDAVTVFITPGFRWPGHLPGQYVRIGVDIEGKRHWRAYSLSSDDAHPEGQITITVKRVDSGVVSPFITRRAAAGSIVTLGEVEGEFTLADRPPAKLLFVTAGSGITPVMAMLSWLERSGEMSDVVHLHSARTCRGGHLRGRARGDGRPARSLHAHPASDFLGRAHPPRAPRRAVSGLAPARDLRLRSRSDARSAAPALRAGRAQHAPAHGVLRTHARRRGRRHGRSRHPVQVTAESRLRWRHADPVGGGARRRRASVRVSHGHLSHLRRHVARGPGP